MSKIITARIPDNTFKELKAYLKSKNMPVSKFITQGLAETSPTLFSPEKINVSKKTEDLLLQTAGGSLIGILVYKLVYAGLSTSKTQYTEAEKEFYAIGAGLSCAIFTSLGISKLIKE